MRCTLCMQVRRCPRNGKRVKADHDATVPQAWEGDSLERELSLASPETGLEVTHQVAGSDNGQPLDFHSFP